METLALIYSAVAYEEVESETKIKSLRELGLEIPGSVWLGCAGVAVTVAVLSQAPDAQAIVKRGDVCAAVTTIQSALDSKGYTVGGVDGAFGNRTEYAVKQFQTRSGLLSDGIVGPSTASQMGLNANLSCASSNVGTSSSSYTTTSGNSSGISGYVTIKDAPNGLRVRSGASQADGVIGYVYSGDVLATTGQKANGFIQLHRGGWVAAEYTNLGGSSSTSRVSSSSYTTVSSNSSGVSGYVTIKDAPNGLRIRSGASQADGVIGYVYSGDVLATTGQKANGFIQLHRGGWVAAEYTNLGGSSSNRTSQGGASQGGTTAAQVVASTGVRFRSGPYVTSSNVIGGAAYGETLSVTSQRASGSGHTWAKLAGGSATGWVATGGLNIR